MKFIDMHGTVSMSALEQVLKPGRGPVKIVVLSGRASGVNTEHFRERFASAFVETALKEQGFGAHLRGWSADFVVEGSFRLPGARPVSALQVDCIQNFWFDSDDEMTAAFAHLGVAQRVRAVSDSIFSAVSWRSFKAEELVFFDHGRAML